MIFRGKEETLKQYQYINSECKKSK